MAMSTLNARICFRRDTLENWENNNPTLLNGEPAIAYDEKTGNTFLKIGDGAHQGQDVPLVNGDTTVQQKVEQYEYKTLNPQYEIL